MATYAQPSSYQQGGRGCADNTHERQRQSAFIGVPTIRSTSTLTCWGKDRFPDDCKFTCDTPSPSAPRGPQHPGANQIAVLSSHHTPPHSPPTQFGMYRPTQLALQHPGNKGNLQPSASPSPPRGSPAPFVANGSAKPPPPGGILMPPGSWQLTTSMISSPLRSNRGSSQNLRPAYGLDKETTVEPQSPETAAEADASQKHAAPQGLELARVNTDGAAAAAADDPGDPGKTRRGSALFSSIRGHFGSTPSNGALSSDARPTTATMSHHQWPPRPTADDLSAASIYSVDRAHLVPVAASPKPRAQTPNGIGRQARLPIMSPFGGSVGKKGYFLGGVQHASMGETSSQGRPPEKKRFSVIKDALQRAGGRDNSIGQASLRTGHMVSAPPTGSWSSRRQQLIQASGDDDFHVGRRSADAMPQPARRAPPPALMTNPPENRRGLGPDAPHLGGPSAHANNVPGGAFLGGMFKSKDMSSEQVPAQAQMAAKPPIETTLRTGSPDGVALGGERRESHPGPHPGQLVQPWELGKRDAIWHMPASDPSSDRPTHGPASPIQQELPADSTAVGGPSYEQTKADSPTLARHQLPLLPTDHAAVTTRKPPAQRARASTEVRPSTDTMRSVRGPPANASHRRNVSSQSLGQQQLLSVQGSPSPSRRGPSSGLCPPANRDGGPMQPMLWPNQNPQQASPQRQTPVPKESRTSPPRECTMTKLLNKVNKAPGASQDGKDRSVKSFLNSFKRASRQHEAVSSRPPSRQAATASTLAQPSYRPHQGRAGSPPLGVVLGATPPLGLTGADSEPQYGQVPIPRGYDFVHGGEMDLQQQHYAGLGRGRQPGPMAMQADMDAVATPPLAHAPSRVGLVHALLHHSAQHSVGSLGADGRVGHGQDRLASRDVRAATSTASPRRERPTMEHVMDGIRQRASPDGSEKSWAASKTQISIHVAPTVDTTGMDDDDYFDATPRRGRSPAPSVSVASRTGAAKSEQDEPAEPASTAVSPSPTNFAETRLPTPPSSALAVVASSSQGQTRTETAPETETSHYAKAFADHKRKETERRAKEAEGLIPAHVPLACASSEPTEENRGGPKMSATSYPGQEWSPYGAGANDEDWE